MSEEKEQGTPTAPEASLRKTPSSSEKEQEKALAPGASLRRTAPDTIDVEIASPHKPSKRRRCAVRCCACCGVTVVVFGLVILILALTVFKVKDPVMTMNSVSVADFQPGFDNSTFTINATVTADISIKNPNAASFRFQNSTTEFYYEGETMGVAYAPSGNAAARRTVRMNVTVDVFADRVLALAVRYPNMTMDAVLGNGVNVNISSYTAVTGRVSVWGLYKKTIDVRMTCTMTIEYLNISRQDITNKVCRANVKSA